MTGGKPTDNQKRILDAAWDNIILIFSVKTEHFYSTPLPRRERTNVPGKPLVGGLPSISLGMIAFGS